jgi:hypothetical protein
MDIKPRYGGGGPKSKFFDGWFAEIYGKYADDKVQITSSTEEARTDINKIIENKEIHYGNGTFSFQTYQALTPAFSLVVPRDWRNTRGY